MLDSPLITINETNLFARDSSLVHDDVLILSTYEFLYVSATYCTYQDILYGRYLLFYGSDLSTYVHRVQIVDVPFTLESSVF